MVFLLDRMRRRSCDDVVRTLSGMIIRRRGRDWKRGHVKKETSSGFTRPSALIAEYKSNDSTHLPLYESPLFPHANSGLCSDSPVQEYIPNFAVLERTLTPRHQNIALMARNKQVARRSSTKPAAEAPPGYAIDPSVGPMLQFQRSLPHLPVPTLSSTASKYLETVRPHLTANEYKDTQKAVDDFVTSPLAAELQERLKARASQPGTVNWLADWWNDVAYMGYRDPVVVFVSYFYVHVDGNTKSQARRAAELIKAMLPFRHLVETYVQPTFRAFGIS